MKKTLVNSSGPLSSSGYVLNSTGVPSRLTLSQSFVELSTRDLSGIVPNLDLETNVLREKHKIQALEAAEREKERVAAEAKAAALALQEQVRLATEAAKASTQANTETLIGGTNIDLDNVNAHVNGTDGTAVALATDDEPGQANGAPVTVAPVTAASSSVPIPQLPQPGSAAVTQPSSTPIPAPKEKSKIQIMMEECNETEEHCRFYLECMNDELDAAIAMLKSNQLGTT
jgi:hypothetical protein